MEEQRRSRHTSRLDATAPPSPALPDPVDGRRAAALESSSPGLRFAATVKKEAVPAPAVEAQEEGRRQGAPHGISLSMVGVRSCRQGGSPPLTRSDATYASEVRLIVHLSRL